MRFSRKRRRALAELAGTPSTVSAERRCRAPGCPLERELSWLLCRGHREIAMVRLDLLPTYRRYVERWSERLRALERAAGD